MSQPDVALSFQMVVRTASVDDFYRIRDTEFIRWFENIRHLIPPFSGSSNLDLWLKKGRFTQESVMSEIRKQLQLSEMNLDSLDEYLAQPEDSHWITRASFFCDWSWDDELSPQELEDLDLLYQVFGLASRPATWGARFTIWSFMPEETAALECNP